MRKDAAKFIDDAERLGHKAEIGGSWVKWTPPLPVVLLMEAVDLSDEIAAELQARIQSANAAVVRPA